MAGVLPPAPSAAIFMEELPQFEWLRGKDLFRATDPATGQVWIIEAAMFAEMVGLAANCYREFRTRRSAEIIRFPLPDHAASADGAGSRTHCDKGT